MSRSESRTCNMYHHSLCCLQHTYRICAYVFPPILPSYHYLFLGVPIFANFLIFVKIFQKSKICIFSFLVFLMCCVALVSFNYVELPLIMSYHYLFLGFPIIRLFLWVFNNVDFWLIKDLRFTLLQIYLFPNHEFFLGFRLWNGRRCVRFPNGRDCLLYNREQR